MLEGLDDIDWSALQHAYGPAADVPEQLRALASDDRARREWAVDKLFGNIFHQGTTYEASAYAVPFLLELAGDDTTPDREAVLALLFRLAIGYDEYVLPHGVPLEYAADPVYAAVAEGVPLVCTLLRTGETAVESWSAALLGWFPARASDTLPALWGRLAEPAASGTAGACLAAIGLLGDGGVAPRLTPFLRDEDPVRRWGAAIALARLAGDDPPAGVLDELLRAARGEVPEVEEPGVVFLYGDMRGYAAESLRLLGPAMRPAAVEAIAHSLARADSYSSLALVHSLLALAFPARVEPATPFAALAPHQQQALLALMRAEWFVTGTGFANVALMLDGSGLPSDARALDAYIRGVEPRRRWRRR